MLTQNRPPSKRLDLLITLLGLLGLALFLALYDQVFPSAAIDLELSRGEVTARAQDYLQAQGHDLTGYQSALDFRQANLASYYLQQTLGVPETNRRARAEGLPLWYWHARWFRPLQKEEFAVDLRPDGQIIGFSHSLPEDAPGANLSQEQARALAESYLTQDRGWALDDWETITASSKAQPGDRTDHHFEWKRRDFDLGESELRLAVDVQGAQVDGYDFWIKTPETYQRHFATRRSQAGFVSGLSYLLGFMVLAGAALSFFLLTVFQNGVVGRATWLPALLVALVSLLAGLNKLPLYKAWYNTTQSLSMFWANRLLNLLITVGYDALLVLVLWTGGRRLAKTVWPHRDKILPRGEDRWQILARSSWRGLMLGGLLGGYLILFYLVATRLLGSWTPLGVPSTDLWATPFPFLAPLELGLLPAMQEELLFRLIGVALVLRLTRRRWLALLVPGALWAFAHMTYVRDPVYLRGIELTLAAVLLEGWFFLRFDLSTTIVAHMTYNAGLMALPLLRAGEPYFVASGGLVLLILLAPVLPGAVQSLWRRLRGRRRAPVQLCIGPATDDDLPALRTLCPNALDWAALLVDPSAVLLCLQASGSPVGVAAGRQVGTTQGEILTVYVAPRWRRRYWGSRLVTALAGRLQAAGVTSLETTVPPQDNVAVAFWVNQDWRPAVKTFRRTLE